MGLPFYAIGYLSRLPTRLGDEVIGQDRAQCPFCQRAQLFDIRKIKAVFRPIPMGTALICSQCAGVSIRQGRVGRWLSVVVLASFGLALAFVFSAGVFGIGSILISGAAVPGWLFVSLLLCGVAGYLEYKVVCAVRSLVGKQDLLPLTAQLHTDLNRLGHSPPADHSSQVPAQSGLSEEEAFAIFQDRLGGGPYPRTVVQKRVVRGRDEPFEEDPVSPGVHGCESEE
jgi:hypothetical protein